MPRITYLDILNYRSIKDSIRITFPENQPVVLVGENNSGKSNIVKALDLVLGEVYPGSHAPEQHEFWGRTSANGAIRIEVGLEGMQKAPGDGMPNIPIVYWSCGKENERPDYQAIPQGSSSIGVTEYIRDQCAVVVIGPDRNLSYQLSYASRTTFLSRLSKRFHSHLVEDAGRTKRLGEKFKELMNIFNEVTEFQDFRTELITNFSNMISGFTHQLGIDFSAYDPRNYFHSLNIIPMDGDEERTYEELGTGEEQVLAFAFAHAYAKAFHGGVVLIVEEPESHLHPLAQQWLSKNIKEMSEHGLQVLITTHSPYFVDLMHLPGLILVTKPAGATKIKQITAKELSDWCLAHNSKIGQTQPDTILPFYAGSSTYETTTGLFSKKVVLVEGQTEQLALPEYLDAIKFDIRGKGVDIIPVIGKGNLAKWWRFFTIYHIPTYVIFDNDSNEDADTKKRQDLLLTVGLAGGDISALMSTGDWVISDQFSIFGKDFEQTLQSHFSKYKVFEDEAQAILGKSKPIIARYVARKLGENIEAAEPGWTKIKELATKLESLQ